MYVKLNTGPGHAGRDLKPAILAGFLSKVPCFIGYDASQGVKTVF